MQNPLEQQAKIPDPIFKDEYSDLLPILDKNATEKERNEILKTHAEKFGRIGFSNGEIDETIEEINSFLSALPEDKLQDIKTFLETLDIDKVNDAIKKGIDRTKSLFPENLIDPKPVLLAGTTNTDGKVIHENPHEFGVNLTNTFSKYYNSDTRKVDEEKLMKKVEDISAHESCHVYCEQLPWFGQKEYGLIGGVFDEGLATSIDTINYPWHEEYVQDAEFWHKIIKESLNFQSEGHMREILERVSKNELLNKYNKGVIKDITDILQKEKVGDKDFSKVMDRALKEKNGPIYHLGFKLWSDIYKQEGVEGIKQKILEGPKSFEKYFE